MRDAPPATGYVQWLPEAANGNRVLRIRTTTPRGAVVEYDYEIEETEGGYYLYRWGKDGRAVIRYFVDCRIAGWSCDCPDSKYVRAGQCKHARGLRAGLKALPF